MTPRLNDGQGNLSVKMLYWPLLAQALEITLAECQEFMIFFHDQPGMYGANSTFGGPHGALISLPGVRQAIRALHERGEAMPLPVQLIWNHMEGLVPEGTDYLWLMNWSQDGPGFTF